MNKLHRQVDQSFISYVSNMSVCQIHMYSMPYEIYELRFSPLLCRETAWANEVKSDIKRFIVIGEAKRKNSYIVHLVLTD